MPDAIFLLQLLAVLAVMIALPVALARWRAGAGWVQIGCALATWSLIQFSTFLRFGGLSAPGEALEWVTIFAMFFGWMSVPMIALTFQLTNTPGWAITYWRSRSRA